MALLTNIDTSNNDTPIFYAVPNNIANAQSFSWIAHPPIHYMEDIAPSEHNSSPLITYMGTTLLNAVENMDATLLISSLAAFELNNRSAQEKFAILNTTNELGITAFRNAAIKGDITLVMPLIEIFKSMPAQLCLTLMEAKSNDFTFSPLSYSIAFGDFDIAKAIIDLIKTLPPSEQLKQISEAKKSKILSANPNIDKTEILNLLDDIEIKAIERSNDQPKNWTETTAGTMRDSSRGI